MIIISATTKPPMTGLGGVIHQWERGLSPWHRSAFPDDLKDYAPEQSEARVEGWFALDGWGNPIAFMADGTEIIEDAEQ